MNARLPTVGEVLVHRFRRRPGEVRVEVVSVDQERRIVRIRMDGKEYSSPIRRGQGRRRHQPERLGLLGPQEAGAAEGAWVLTTHNERWEHTFASIAASAR